MDKKLISMLFSGVLLAAPLSMRAQYHSQVWNPDNGNGTYTNPVLYADYSDPDGRHRPIVGRGRSFPCPPLRIRASPIRRKGLWSSP